MTRIFVRDANRDGLFVTNDLLLVLNAGEYEDDITKNSDWADGDWQRTLGRHDILTG